MTQKMQAGNEGAGEIGREKKHAGWRKARPPPAADAVAHLLSGRRAGFRSGFIASEKKNKNATLKKRRQPFVASMCCKVAHLKV